MLFSIRICPETNFMQFTVNEPTFNTFQMKVEQARGINNVHYFS